MNYVLRFNMLTFLFSNNTLSFQLVVINKLKHWKSLVHKKSTLNFLIKLKEKRRCRQIQLIHLLLKKKHYNNYFGFEKIVILIILQKVLLIIALLSNISFKSSIFILILYGSIFSQETVSVGKLFHKLIARLKKSFVVE